jgi:hypothetical protein
MSSLINLCLLKSVECEALAAATLNPDTRVQYQRLAQQWRELATGEQRKKPPSATDVSDEPSDDAAASIW